MQLDQIRRREFITLLGGAAVAWPHVARAQQPAMPVIGLLNPTSLEANAERLRAYHQGLKEAGFDEGKNVAIEYRWADSQVDRLPALAADLVRRRVAVIAAVGGQASAEAAKAATATIPVVFVVGEDPVGSGLVASLASPGGNLTGINFFAAELAAKRLGLLRALVPTAARVAVFVSTDSSADAVERDARAAGSALGLHIQVHNISTGRDIDAAFAAFERERPDALLVAATAVFTQRRMQLATLAVRHAIPMAGGNREMVEAGGLMSYGASSVDAWRQAGVYTGRILKGAKPADLPVVQATKFALIINAHVARMLGLTVPHALLASADEVIE